jgi:Domain of unknown function (DUF4180)
MDYRIEEVNGHRLLVLDGEGTALTRVQDVLELVAEALPRRVSMIVVTVARLDPTFFELRSGLAGEFVQKIVNYRLRLAVIGDISEFTANCAALTDFVRESNRGRSIFFVHDLAALVEKLAAPLESRVSRCETRRKTRK